MLVSELKYDDRVQLHPATDAWMAGDRYGQITHIGRKIVHVLCDSGKLRRMSPADILEVVREAGEPRT